MKKKLTKLILVAILSLASSYYSFSQTNIIQQGENGLAPRFAQFENEAQLPLSSYKNMLYENLNIDKSFQFIEVSKETDELGITHLKIQQYLNGYPVENAFYVVHARKGKIVSANGEVFKESPLQNKGLLKRANISEEQAFLRAKQLLKGNVKKWQDESKRSLGTEQNLVYICEKNNLDIKNLKLSYKFDLYSEEPLDRKKVYIDVSNGEFVFSEDLKHSAFLNEDTCSLKHKAGNSEEEIFVAGSTQTGFYGSKNITVSESSGKYLATQTGNRNITITNLNGRSIGFSNTPPSGGSIISSSTPDGFGRSGNEGYYMAAYWGAEKTWDMLKEHFGRASYNGSSGKINIFVNGSGQGADNNAFWIGSWTYFGNASSGAPFTPLDVVGHEIAHGVTQTSAGLVYQNESGAMNEGFSDIFGCYAEYYTFNRIDNNVWTLGEHISFQRSLSNPKQHRQPDTYKGTNWYSGTGDNGGVHTNSGVLNHWFYILTQGKTGTNDKGSSYDVKGIGIEKAGQIAYRALTRYLTSSSNYASARNAVINAATDLYGANSCEVVATTDAMYAVGIGSKYSGNGCSTNECSSIQNLAASNISESSAQISWAAKTGVSSYQLEYKKSSSSSYSQVSVNGSTKELSGLSTNTSYDVRVTYSCDGKLAPYSSVVKFATKSEPAKCDAVTDVKALDIKESSALISWAAKNNVQSYTLEYKVASNSSYVSLNANSNTYALSNLKPNTTYNVRIKYACGTTDTGCDGIDAYQPYPKIYYAGDKATYNGRKYECTANGIYNITPTGSVYSYLWKDLGACSSSLNEVMTDAPYSTVISFTTLDDTTTSCNAVTNLKSADVTKNSANITWSKVADIETYELQYKKATASSFTSVNLLGVNYVLTSLEEKTTYEVRIGYTCSDGAKSPYSNLISFTTEGATDTGCDGIPEYQDGVMYQKGDKALFTGNVWEAQITAWWSPNYGYWTNLGPCSNAGNSFIYKIFPNPIKDGVLNLEFVNKPAENLSISVSDLSGNVLQHMVMASSSYDQSNKAVINVSNLKPGIYLIKINGVLNKMIIEK